VFGRKLARAIFSRIPALAVVLAAGVGFWFLAHGGSLDTVSAHAYAEELNHAFGPVRAGKIAEVVVKLGQRVKAGEVLLRMERRELEAQRDLLRAQLERVKAEVLAETDRQEADVLRTEIWVLRARANAKQDLAELAELKRQLARLEGLASAQLVRQTELEQRRRFQEGLAARTTAYSEAARRGRGGGVVGDGSRMSRAEQIKTRVAPFRAAVLAKEAELRLIELQLEETVVRSHVEGTVAGLLRRPGEVVAAGTGVVSVVTSRPGFVVAWLPARQARSVKLGDAAVVRRARLLGAKISGRVVEIGPEVEELPARIRIAPNARQWGRRVTIATQSQDLLPGEELNVRL